MSRPVRTMLALGALALTVPAHRAAAQEQDGRSLVRSVTLDGVRNVDRMQLADGLATKGSRCKTFLYAPICLLTRSPLFNVRRYIDPVEVKRDELRIRLFYWRRGYRDAAVASRIVPARGGVRVVFDIKENAPTVIENLAIVQRDSILPQSAISRAVRLQAGDALDLVAMDSSIYMLQTVLFDRGYADGIVELDTSQVDNARNAGPVSLILEPGPRTTVRAIEIDGNRRVSDLTVARLLRFGRGDLYRRSAVLESQRDLYMSGLFSEVELRAAPNGDSAKTVQVTLTEGPLHTLELAGGLTTADFVQLEALFTRYNFMGGARRLTVRGTLSNLLAPQLNGSGVFYDVTNGALPDERDPFMQPTWSASVDFTQPWFLSAGNELGASIFTHRRSVPGIVTDFGAGATLALTRDLGLRSSATIGYTYEASTIQASDLYFCVTAGLCVPATIDVISRRHPLAPVALAARHDATNDAFTPNRGQRVRADVEHASRLTGSDYQYNRTTLTASTYHRVGRASVLAGRVRLGYVRALGDGNASLGIPGDTASHVLHPRKQFFAGGSQSVRGYGENQLGPRVLTIDPARLTDTSHALSCTTGSIAAGTCDPNQPGISARDFQPRPLGGTSLAEASVEYRFPVSLVRGLTGAVFVDGAVVSTRRFSNLFGATAAITPGFGVRFNTPVGPVRLDLGIRPKTVEQLPVITQVSDSAGNLQLVMLQTKRRYDQTETTGGALRRVLSRLTLHLAIGPAF